MADGNRISFKAEGALDAVVKAAARHTVRDLEVAHPTLEVFLTYYGGTARDDRGRVEGGSGRADAGARSLRNRSLRAVVRRGLRDHRRAPLAWGLPLGAMCALIVGIYPSIQDSLNELTKNYPEGLKQAFGIEQLDSAEAYLDAEMFSLIVPLTLAFFAVRSISREISVAEERGYLDTTLAAPLSRRALVAGSFAVTALASAVLAAVFALTMIAAVAAGAGLSLGKLAAGVANVWPLAVFSAGLAVLAAGSLHRSAPVTAIARHPRGHVRRRPGGQARRRRGTVPLGDRLQVRGSGLTRARSRPPSSGSPLWSCAGVRGQPALRAARRACLVLGALSIGSSPQQRFGSRRMAGGPSGPMLA